MASSPGSASFSSRHPVLSLGKEGGTGLSLCACVPVLCYPPAEGPLSQDWVQTIWAQYSLSPITDSVSPSPDTPGLEFGDRLGAVGNGICPGSQQG